MSTKIGPDMPQELLQPLIQAGVDVTGIQKTDRTTTTELIYDEQGHKEIRYPTKATPITVEDIPKSYHGCRLIYICPMDNDVLRKTWLMSSLWGKSAPSTSADTAEFT